MKKKYTPFKDDTKKFFELDFSEKETFVYVQEEWNANTAPFIVKRLDEILKYQEQNIIISLTKIKHLDTAGMWLIVHLQKDLEKFSNNVEIRDIPQDWIPLFETVTEKFYDVTQKPAETDNSDGKTKFLEHFTEKFIEIKEYVKAITYIIGVGVSDLWNKRPWNANKTKNEFSVYAIIAQIEKMGVNALPIISLMSFIVGAIVAQQGAFQLRRYGGEIFVVNLIGILVLREMALLLTAILVAGRSGSAITAEIGAMKMREEIDALKVMGLDAVRTLIFSRIIALLIVLPLLSIVSIIFSLLGASIIANYYSGIPYHLFFGRFCETMRLTVYLAGLFKAPFIALIIGFISTLEGLKVQGDTTSLGQRVTSSVVKTIFTIIVVNGLFAVGYAAIGV